MSFDADAYLTRLGLEAIEPGAAGLAALQTAQLGAIPFENLDPLLGKVPELSEQALWAKLMTGRRGGYCYELNGLLGQALKAFGFAAEPVLARVRRGGVRGARSHLAWIAQADGASWLVDAGFGGPGPAAPLRLAPGTVQEIGAIAFRLSEEAETGETVLERRTGTDWVGLYGFDRVPVWEMDVAAANYLSARWERSPFPAHLMLNAISPRSRESLFDRTGRTERDGRVEEWQVQSAADLHRTLSGRFAIEVDAAVAEAAWQRIAAQPGG